MIELLGFLGALFLGVCALPEVVSSIRRGYCGTSWGFLLVWFIGEVFTLLYVFFTSKDIYLLCNYSLNVILIKVLFYYKTKIPRQEPVKVITNLLPLKDTDV